MKYHMTLCSGSQPSQPKNRISGVFWWCQRAEKFNAKCWNKSS